MASIHSKKRKNSVKYYIVYRITGSDGKKQMKWYPCKDKNEARLLLDDVAQAEKEDREYKPQESSAYSKKEKDYSQMSVKDLVLKYANEYAEWEAKTYHANMGLIRNYIIPFIGDYPILEVDTPFLMEYYADLQTKKAVPGNHLSEPGYISARTIRDINKILSPAFRYAIFLRLIPSNPVSGLKLPKIEKNPRKRWSEEDFIRAITVCQDGDLKLMMCLMVNCTLRSGELFGLTWDCISLKKSPDDSEPSIVHVKKELARLNKSAIEATKTKIYLTFPNMKLNAETVEVLKKPKTQQSIRSVFLSPQVRDLLIEHKAVQTQWKQEIGSDYQDFDLVLAQENGRPYTHGMVSKKFKRFCKENNFPEVDFYSLRHTGATAKYRISKNIKAVQRDMGDKSSNVLLEHYLDAVDEDRQESTITMGNNIFSKLDKSAQDNES